MSFIKIKRSYNPLTTQGEGEKLINTSHIVSITKWTNKTNKRISSIKARIKLIDGEILDIKEAPDEVLQMIEAANLS
jgi:hypothetical protein